MQQVETAVGKGHRAAGGTISRHERGELVAANERAHR
jgi:hypothetical protein